MYHHATSISLSLLRFLVVGAVLLLGAVEAGYGQEKVYANSYGASQSGRGVPLLTASAFVTDPLNAITPNSLNGNFTELSIGGGLIGTANATYQLEFINNGENLPRGTSVYVKFEDNTNVGLLGLALATEGFLSAYANANSANTMENLTGDEIPLGDDEVIISGDYLIITPSHCFNAIRLSIVSGGLLGLLTTGNVRAYHAYYECPEIVIPEPGPICEGAAVNLAIMDPFACGEYHWYDDPTGGTLLHTGTTYNPSPEATTTYYVEYSGIDTSECGRIPVGVTVLPLPGKPHLTITDHN